MNKLKIVVELDCDTNTVFIMRNLIDSLLEKKVDGKFLKTAITRVIE